MRSMVLPVLCLLASAGCGGTTDEDPPATSTPAAATASDNCHNTDSSLSGAAFVIVTEPFAGERVSSGFTVTGCSSTFESTVQWRLLARDGTALNEGSTQGGGVDGYGPFSFSVTFQVPMRQIGHLEVHAPDVSEGEGFPPGRTVLPLVLVP